MQIGKNVGKKCEDKIYSTTSQKISDFSVSKLDGSSFKMGFKSDKKVYELGIRIEASSASTEFKIDDVPTTVEQSPVLSETEGEKYKYELIFAPNGSGTFKVVLTLVKGKDGKNGAVRRNGSVKLEDSDTGALL